MTDDNFLEEANEKFSNLNKISAVMHGDAYRDLRGVSPDKNPRQWEMILKNRLNKSFPKFKKVSNDDLEFLNSMSGERRMEIASLLKDQMVVNLRVDNGLRETSSRLITIFPEMSHKYEFVENQMAKIIAQLE